MPLVTNVQPWGWPVSLLPLQRLNRVHLAADAVCCDFEVVLGLEAHPEAR